MSLEKEYADKIPYIKAIRDSTSLYTASELFLKPIDYLKDTAEMFSPGIIAENTEKTDERRGLRNFFDSETQTWMKF